ncbi:DUF3850 domain-containing protein [Alicyclobacillus dauci]|uniref:DUF3850 domain-containing protein n=2 Tax=Alicyclobacillus dauci TaxID=1475485 RepID=A0ABY6Z8P2_9BACL|nr:DUF3850 domain-containing protein [Alicyclobacillus dauci]
MHELKIWPEHFSAVESGDKTVELRRDDREFAVGDTLALGEWNPTTQTYTGRTCTVRVTHILRGGPWLSDGYVAISISVMNDRSSELSRMKVYISGPMSGIAEFNRPVFDNAAEMLREAGYNVFNPGAVRINGEWEDFMRHDIKAQMDCDVVVLLQNWHMSRGSQLEVYLAKQLGIRVCELDDFLNKRYVEERKT